MAGGIQPEPEFLASGADFRAWLEEHHGDRDHLWIGFPKKGSGLDGISYAEALDEALCFGWIDGVRKNVDDGRWTIRFSPRKAASIWSAINIRRAEELAALGLLRPSGQRVFEARRDDRSRVYAYEQKTAEFDEVTAARFRAHREAWAYFGAQPKTYRQSATWWVISAKRQDTRERRLARLVADSDSGRWLAHLTRKPAARRSPPP